MMRTNIRRIIFLSFILFFAGCASKPASDEDHSQHQSKQHSEMSHADHASNDAHAMHSEHGKDQYVGAANAVAMTTKDGLYKVSLFSNESPIPLQKIHSWTLHVETADGKPAEKLKIYVNGGMPMHRHGFPTKPSMSGHVADGNYTVEGIKFNMPGHWEMRFNITEKGAPGGRGKKDRAIFKIHLK